MIRHLAASMSRLLVWLLVAGMPWTVWAAEFRAGAAAVDISPPKLPVLVNGGMLSRTADQLVTPLYARAIACDDGTTRLVLVVVDSCMMPRELLDQAKELASRSTGIPTSHMLISATHAHSVPSTFACLGTEADTEYSAFLRVKLAAAIQQAVERLEPAQVGWAVADASPYTAVRRWVRRPDRMLEDPFGNFTVRANMHPGFLSPEATGPSGPTDPDLSLIAFQSRDGRPLAVFANFCMHYFGAPALSADYFGLFADGLRTKVAAHSDGTSAAFVGIMSHGTSGDIWRRDYLQPPPEKDHTLESYTSELVEVAHRAYRGIRFRSDVTLAMAEALLPLKYRVPDQQRLKWAQEIVAGMEGRLPKDRTEVYAREAVLLHEKQQTELKLQAVRIGEIGLTAIPNEVYALTGLKLKALSPLRPTINIDLANGAEGYIPPPEQHLLGGYNTWPARSAGLEVQAEPKIVEVVLQLLEQVAAAPRRPYSPQPGPAAQAVLDSRPLAYWRLDEFQGGRAIDRVGHLDGIYEPGCVFFLEGPESTRFNADGEVNRAVHLAGGRIAVQTRGVGETYSVSLWCWNGMPNDARPVGGYLFARGRDHAFPDQSDRLGIGGTAGHGGRLIFNSRSTAAETLAGRTEIPRWTWSHVVLVRQGANVRVHLNGSREPEIEGVLEPSLGPEVQSFFVGGSGNREASFEGRLDEVSLYDRALTLDEIEQLYLAARSR